MEVRSRFDWGGIDIHFDIIEGKIAHPVVFSDSMDEAFIRALPGQLDGGQFRSGTGLLEKIAKLHEARLRG
jgi:lipoate-protein ligase A